MSIIHYFSLHVESARSALKQLLRQPFGTLLTLIMLAVAMTLPLFMYLGIQSGQSVLGKLNESPQITVYMETAAAQSDSDTVRNLLTRDKRLDNIRFIGKEDGLAELQSNLDQNLISMLDGNPCRMSLSLPRPGNHARPNAGNLPGHYQAAYGRIRVYGYRMGANAVPNQRVHPQNLMVSFLTLGMAFVLVAHNTIRLQILSRKEEIEITKLLVRPRRLSAAPSFIRLCGRVSSPPPSA